MEPSHGIASKLELIPVLRSILFVSKRTVQKISMVELPYSAIKVEENEVKFKLNRVLSDASRVSRTLCLS